MRHVLFIATALFVMGLAFWAYRENYRTQGELREVRALRQEIGELRESLAVLRAEWAYLNRPDRLRELAEINFSRLQLLPLMPQQFGDIRDVPYPVLTGAVAGDPVDLSASTEAAP
ncbi:MAG: cell division protein FtsL [Rhodobacteraceae bacterium]|nr:cell division protein FtsL [Paracoccaceae bacterium]